MSNLVISVIVSYLVTTCVSRPDYGFSAYCQPCISPCEQQKSPDPKERYYFCQTYDYSFNNHVYTWDHCSPNSSTDYLGNNCSSSCAFYGEDYQWCTTGETWGYCSGPFCNSQATELPDYGYSTYCQSCITPCEQVNTKYYWCGTRKWNMNNQTWAWDYCSPNNGVDYKGNRCLSKCRFRDDLNYQSCITEEGGEGYCTGKGNVLCDFI